MNQEHSRIEYQPPQNLESDRPIETPEDLFTHAHLMRFHLRALRKASEPPVSEDHPTHQLRQHLISQLHKAFTHLIEFLAGLEDHPHNQLAVLCFGQETIQACRRVVSQDTQADKKLYRHLAWGLNTAKHLEKDDQSQPRDQQFRTRFKQRSGLKSFFV